MNAIRVKLERFKIDWDGPIVILYNDQVTILSPFKILMILENVRDKIRSRIYQRLNQLKTRTSLIHFFEILGKQLLTIRV